MRVLALALPAAMAAVVGTACGSGAQHSAEQQVKDVVDRYDAARFAGDLMALRPTLCPSLVALTKDATPQSWRAYYRKVEFQYGPTLVDRFDRVSVDGDRAHVEVSFHNDVPPQSPYFGDLFDASGHATIDLVRVGGDWKVCKDLTPDDATNKDLGVRGARADLRVSTRQWYAELIAVADNPDAADIRPVTDLTCGDLRTRLLGQSAEQVREFARDQGRVASVDSADVDLKSDGTAGDTGRVTVTAVRDGQTHRARWRAQLVDGDWHFCALEA